LLIFDKYTFIKKELAIVCQLSYQRKRFLILFNEKLYNSIQKIKWKTCRNFLLFLAV